MRRLIIKMVNKDTIKALRTMGNIIYESDYIDIVCMDVEEINIEKIKRIPGVANVREEREGELMSCYIH